MAVASLFYRRENLGHGIKSDLKTSRSFLNHFSWDYSVSGGLTPVISWCSILSFDNHDNAKVRSQCERS